VRRVVAGLAVAAAALFAADFVVARHGHLAPEEWPGFLGAFGFAAGCAAVLAAVALRVLLKGPPEAGDEEESRG